MNTIVEIEVTGKEELPDAKVIVNDYDYRGWRFKVKSNRENRK